MRLFRGMLVTALLWGMAWAIGLAPLLVLGWRAAEFPRPLWMLGVNLLAVGCWGAISGCVFALLLWMAERGGGWSTLRTGRVALWGLVAGLVPGLLFGIVEQGIRWPSLGVLLIAGVSGLLGVVLALLNLRIAQRPRST